MNELIAAYSESGLLGLVVVAACFMFYRQQKRIDRIDKATEEREKNAGIREQQAYDREKEYQTIVAQQNVIITSLSSELPDIRKAQEEILNKIDRGVTSGQRRTPKESECDCQ